MIRLPATALAIATAMLAQAAIPTEVSTIFGVIRDGGAVVAIFALIWIQKNERAEYALLMATRDKEFLAALKEQREQNEKTIERQFVICNKFAEGYSKLESSLTTIDHSIKTHEQAFTDLRVEIGRGKRPA